MMYLEYFGGVYLYDVFWNILEGCGFVEIPTLKPTFLCRSSGTTCKLRPFRINFQSLGTLTCFGNMNMDIKGIFEEEFSLIMNKIVKSLW